jgi:hypothetical protein
MMLYNSSRRRRINILKMLEKEEKMTGRLGALQAAISGLSGGNRVLGRVSKLKGRKLSRAHRLAIRRGWAARRKALAKN